MSELEFRFYQVNHPHLVAAKERLMASLNIAGETNSHRRFVEQLIIESALLLFDQQQFVIFDSLLGALYGLTDTDPPHYGWEDKAVAFHNLFAACAAKRRSTACTCGLTEH